MVSLPVHCEDPYMGKRGVESVPMATRPPVRLFWVGLHLPMRNAVSETMSALPIPVISICGAPIFGLHERVER